jgi:hypothetical protein
LANHKQELPMVAMGILFRLSSFREKNLEIDQPETRIAYATEFLVILGIVVSVLRFMDCDYPLMSSIFS